MSNNKVKIKDMDETIHRLLVAFRAVGLSIDYETTYLITTVFNKIDQEESFTLKDAIELQSEHEQKWFDYHKNQNKDHD